MTPETKPERRSSRIQRSITRLNIIERTSTAQDSLYDSEDSDDEPVRQRKPRGQKSTFSDLSRMVQDVKKEHLDLETEINTLNVKLEEREDHTNVQTDEVRRTTAEVKATAKSSRRAWRG
jgi:hypothetical protein